jgi:hypothetical protein
MYRVTMRLLPETYVGRCVKYPPFFSGFKKNVMSPQFLVKLSEHQVSQTSLSRFSSYWMRVDGQTWQSQ